MLPAWKRKLAAILTGAFISPLYAATPTNLAANDAWRFSVIPYLWALNMNGRVQVKDRAMHVDETFSDILQEMNWGGMVFLEANKGRFGLFGNALYALLTNDTREGPVYVAGRNGFGIFSAGASYQAYQHCFGCGLNQSAITIEPYIGARYTLNNTQVKASAGPFFIRRSDNQHWTDPIIGARLRYDINKAWEVILAGDVGGTNTSSHYSYNVFGVIGYNPQTILTNTTAYLGYRLLDQHYVTGSSSNYYNWDMKLFGPVLGFAINF